MGPKTQNSAERRFVNVSNRSRQKNQQRRLLLCFLEGDVLAECFAVLAELDFLFDFLLILAAPIHLARLLIL